MYESFFQFRQRPFASTPQADRFFPSETIEAARITLARGVERAEGPGVVIGPAGTGKSLLCEILARQFRSKFQVALLAGAGLRTRRALLQNILFELSLPYRDMEDGELRLSLIDHLEPNPQNPNGLVLIVDEAHALPPRLLEEIRMITNIVREGRPRVRLVLAGGSALEEKFAHPKLESFNQRIAARCYLQPLRRDETVAYVQFQTRDVGGRSQPVFTHEALSAIYQATNGIPRLINQVCDHALLMASLGGIALLDAEGIEEAWADLQQLPAPWNDSPPRGAPLADSDIIEFGALDEDSTEPLTAASTDSPLDSDAYESYDDTDLHAAVVPIQPGRPWLSDESRSKPTPASASASEAPQVAPAADPFGSDFEEEELVIDRYATLDALTANRLPRVTSVDGESLAALLFGPTDRFPAKDLVAAGRSEWRSDVRRQVSELRSTAGEKARPAVVKTSLPVRYEAPAHQTPASTRKIPWPESAIATAIVTASEPKVVSTPDWVKSGVEPQPALAAIKQLEPPPFHPSEDPVMPEPYGVSEGDSVLAPQSPPTPTTTERTAVVSVDDGPFNPEPHLPVGTGNQRGRQEYRRLFATLRRSDGNRSKTNP